MSAANRISVFGSSSNDTGWQVAIFTVRGGGLAVLAGRSRSPWPGGRWDWLRCQAPIIDRLHNRTRRWSNASAVDSDFRPSILIPARR